MDLGLCLKNWTLYQKLDFVSKIGFGIKNMIPFSKLSYKLFHKLLLVLLFYNLKLKYNYV